MRVEKHEEAISEVMEAIKCALEDERGLCAHQRRLSALLSVGLQHLIELYFHKLGTIKSGAYVKHTWFRMADDKIKLRLKAVTTTINLPKLNEIIALAKELEAGRDELLYGAPIRKEDILRKKISIFFDLKELIEE